MANENGVIRQENLKDGIYFEETENFLKYAVPKTKPELTLKEVKDVQTGKVLTYEVPKNLIYAQERHKLVDGSVVTILRYKPIAQEVREKFHEAALNAWRSGALPDTYRNPQNGEVTGARLLPLSEPSKAVNAKRPKITFASLQ